MQAPLLVEPGKERIGSQKKKGQVKMCGQHDVSPPHILDLLKTECVFLFKEIFLLTFRVCLVERDNEQSSESTKINHLCLKIGKLREYFLWHKILVEIFLNKIKLHHNLKHLKYEQSFQARMHTYSAKKQERNIIKFILQVCEYFNPTATSTTTSVHKTKKMRKS
ncbi:unnamed protein product [Ceratitis capitata]|uniref:(Mediterranean fruit fly) hypothetical protein n=1 Tax=Ceratitis capitata TaxID=7213 RepID=A0A811VEU6_CERCA|nr:unnamed protein product [Ceratitis capitata]